MVYEEEESRVRIESLANDEYVSQAGLMRSERDDDGKKLKELGWLQSVSWESLKNGLVNVSDSATCVQVIQNNSNKSGDEDECVMESLSTLITARALMKNRTSSEDAWRSLEALMLTQGSNGFFPKYAYLKQANSTAAGDGAGDSHGWYLPADLFDKLQVPAVYLPEKKSMVNHHHHQGGGNSLWSLKTSGRISAVPFHASFVLDTFYLSAQHQADVKRLSNFFCRLYRWHMYLHTILLPIHCPNPNSPSCFNVIHPWETIFPFHPQLINLPFWSQAFNTSSSLSSIQHKLHSLFACQQTQNHNNNTKNHDKPKNINRVRSTAAADAATSNGMNPAGVQESRLYEEHIMTNCQNWAMMDVTYAAALAQSNRDLQQILNLLSVKNDPIIRTISFSNVNATLTKWIQQSQQILQSSYHPKHKTFLNSISNTPETPPPKQTLPPVPTTKSRPIPQPVAFNFMGAWLKETALQSKLNKEITEMSFLIFESEGKFSFNCHTYPLSLSGNCNQTNLQSSSSSSQHTHILSPTLNFVLSIGFQNNDFHGISPYLQTSTLNSICRLPQNSFDYNLTQNCHKAFQQSQHSSSSKTTTMPFFPPYLLASPQSSMRPSSSFNKVINVTATSTAAALYNILIPDPPFFQYQANPPIRNEVVLAIIAIELFLAFGIGVSCLLLNFNLMRRLKKEDEEDTFVQRLHDRRTLLSQIYGRSAEDDPSAAAVDDNDVEPVDHLEDSDPTQSQHQQHQSSSPTQNNNHDHNQSYRNLNSNDSTATRKTKTWSSTYASASNYVTSSSLWQKFSPSSDNNNEMTNNNIT